MVKIKVYCNNGETITGSLDKDFEQTMRDTFDFDKKFVFFNDCMIRASIIDMVKVIEVIP